MAESVKKSFLSGTFWTSGQQIILTVIGLLQLAITSRLLTPTDFGTYAVATFFSSLGNVAFAMGFSAALIQKKGDVSSYLNTTWTASIGVASIASIAILALVPFICSFYFHNTSAIWPSVVIMLNCILIAASNPGLIIYQKEIQLKKIFLLNVSAKVFSFILVLFFVYIFKSYWGLIIALLSESIFRLICSYFLHPYRPKLEFNWQNFKELYAFSGWIQLKNITAWLSGSLDTAVVGNLLGAYKLGFFNRAQTVASYPRLLVNTVVDTVAFPLYAKVNDNQEKMQSVFNQIQDGIIILVGAMAMVFISFGYQIISLILGDQWVGMVIVFRVLLIAYLIQTLFLSFIPVLRAYGYTKQEFIIYVMNIILMIGLLYIFIGKYDLTGAGVATLLCVLLIYPGMLVYVHKKTGLQMKHYMMSLFVTICSVIIVISVLSFFELSKNNIFIWCFEAAITCIAYFIVVFLIGVIFKVGPGLLFNKIMK